MTEHEYETLTASIPGPPTSGNSQAYAQWAASVASTMHHQLWLILGIDQRRKVIHEFRDNRGVDRYEAEQFLLSASHCDGGFLVGMILHWTRRNPIVDGFQTAERMDALLCAYEQAMDEVLRLKVRDTPPPPFEKRGARCV